MRTTVRPILLGLGLALAGSLQLQAGTSADTVSKYFTNFGHNTVTVLVETAVPDNGAFKAGKTIEKDLAPGARNVAIAIPGREVYQIEFTMVEKGSPDKVYGIGQRINENKYFSVDDDMMVEMQNNPFN